MIHSSNSLNQIALQHKIMNCTMLYLDNYFMNNTDFLQ